MTSDADTAQTERSFDDLTYEHAIRILEQYRDMSDSELKALWEKFADMKSICQANMDVLKAERSARMDAKIEKLHLQIGESGVGRS